MHEPKTTLSRADVFLIPPIRWRRRAARSPASAQRRLLPNSRDFHYPVCWRCFDTTIPCSPAKAGAQALVKLRASAALDPTFARERLYPSPEVRRETPIAPRQQAEHRRGAGQHAVDGRSTAIGLAAISLKKLILAIA